MDFDIADFLKKLLPSWLGQMGDSLVTGLGGIWGFIANALGLTDKLKEGIATVSTTITEKIDPSLGIAQKTLPARAVDKEIYTPIASTLGIAEDSTIINGLKTIMKNTAQSFVQNGVPGLKDGRPIAAVTAAREAYNQIFSYLAGDGQTELGALLSQNSSLTTEQRSQIASGVATYLTGVDANSGIELALNVPKNGLVNMLAAAQTALDGKKELKESDITLTLNAGVLTAQAAATKATETTKTAITGGTEASAPSAPLPGPKTQGSLVIK